MAKILCRWCRHEFEKEIVHTTEKGEKIRSIVTCPKCFRVLPSSIKEPIEDKFVGRLHIHREY